MKRCPFCAEEIQDAAVVCKYCGRDLAKPVVLQATPIPVAAPAAPPRKKRAGWTWPVIGGLALCACVMCVIAPLVADPGALESSNATNVALLSASLGTTVATAAPDETSRPRTDAPTPTRGATASPVPSATAAWAGASAWMTYGDRRVGVTEITWNDYLGYYRAERGKVLVSLYIVAINDGDSEINFNPLDFKLIDGGGEVSGKIYGPEREPVFSPCRIQPGGACEGWWTTEIWDREEVRAALTLRWSPGLLDAYQETAVEP